MSLTELKNFPSLEQINLGIKELNNYNFVVPNANDSIEKHIEEIHKVFTSKIFLLPQIIRLYKNLQTSPFTFYRVRPYNAEINIFDCSQFSFPPPVDSTLQRANLPGYPVFYTATDPLTAFSEVIKNVENFKKNPNQKYLLSCWKIIPPFNMKLAHFLYKSVDKGNDFYELSLFLENELEKSYHIDLSNEKKIVLNKIYEFCTKSFLNDQSYAVSSYLAFKYFYSPIEISADLLMYPSNSTKNRTVNFAINPQFVNKYMKLNSAYLCTVNHFNKVNNMVENVNVKPHDYMCVKNDKLIWNQINNGNPEFLKQFQSDFKTVYRKLFK